MYLEGNGDVCFDRYHRVQIKAHYINTTSHHARAKHHNSGPGPNITYEDKTQVVNGLGKGKGGVG